MNLILVLAPIVAGISVCYGFRLLDNSRFAVKGVVGPYFAAIALLFGLFASLIATELWQRVAHANRTVETEMNALRSLLRLDEAFHPAGGHIRPQVNAYLASLANDLSPSRTPTTEEDSFDAIRKLYAVAAAPDAFRGNVGALSAYLQSLETVRSSRIERLAERNRRISPEKFIVLFIFGVLTQIAIGLCHAGQPRALAAAVMLFSIAFSVAVGILGLLDDPYKGTHLIVTNVASSLP